MGTFYRKMDFKQGLSIMHAGPSEEKSKSRQGLFSGSLLFYLMRQLFKENVIVIPGGHGLVSRNTGETVLCIKKADDEFALYFIS